MTITLNNLEYPSNLITFTDIPNILKVEDDAGGTYATITFSVVGDFRTHSYQPYRDGLFDITVLGETITNVVNAADAVNKHYYISNSLVSTAASIAAAFRDCQGLAAMFNIQHSGAVVTLTAKSFGSIVNGTDNIVSTNIPSMYFPIVITDGSSNSPLDKNKINVDVYNGDTYITTLQKYFYNGEVAYNLSPLLTTFAEYGNTLPYRLVISSIIDGEYTLLGNVDTNYISIGYMVNQGAKYLFDYYLTVAQNYNRGTNKDADNNTLLYLYAPTIPISFYNGDTGGMTITIDYLDSAYNSFTSSTISWSSSSSSKKLWDLDLQLNGALLNQAFYIDVSLGSAAKIRYNVIKPIKATEYYQRILWRNSYGGISFFDFTGQKTETRDLDISTYEKNIFGYYTDQKNELEKVYNNEVKYNVTLKSHLFENDGKYIFNDLLQSANVWTRINGQDYAIIIDSVSVDETDNNNIYEATVKYHYSQEPSLI